VKYENIVSDRETLSTEGRQHPHKNRLHRVMARKIVMNVSVV
jgi:hypothetical protein